MSESTSFLTSDHFIFSFYVEHTPSPTKRFISSLVFDYTNADYEGLCDILFESDSSYCFLSDSIEQVYVVIYKTHYSQRNELVYPAHN